ncbi:uncharacterized protein FTOL_01479 [Fusarium torulosum]|uniref:Uncharacterized protein n=1 Tax=Fusarium torulosum TaxID=33205 RepID=A0AAE8M015_9HYPO|nr:uncharacterized protein FTOL_01479 [Fusarium torulosum]
MSLETLAPELVALVLQNVDSPHSLHDLITASPACLRTFSQAPQPILSAVIRNALPGETVKHFLAVLQTPSPSTTSLVSQFLDKYFSLSSSFDFPTTKPDIISLYQLYNRVNFIITRYLHQMQELGLGESILVPSASECIRLQRAFLRFEIYSRVFPADDTRPWETPSSNHPFSAAEQFDLYLSQLAPWEAEEMACVELYFSLLIGNFVDQLEEQLIDAVKGCTGIVWPLSPETTQAAETKIKEELDKIHNQETLKEFKNLDLTNLSLFSKDGIHYPTAHISYMTSLGLDFIYNLCISESRRSELMRSNSPYFREFLPEALHHSPTRTLEHEGEGSLSTEWDTDDNPHRHNLGYHLFGKDRDNEMIYIAISPNSSYYSVLRQLGYVFWDSARIRSSELSERLEAAGSATFNRGQFDRRWKKGAEARLEGVRLPRDQFEEIERKFGDIRRPLPEGCE